MTDFAQKLKQFLHDPIDKCLDIPNHIQRAKEYAELVGVRNVEEIKEPDWIASCMERSLLPKDIIQEFSEVRHPFTQGKIEVKGINKDTIFNSVKNAFGVIGKEIEHWDDKKKFLYLWRNIIEVVSEKLKDDPLKYISILPADTRIPDHSIWEHIKITSAINAFERLQNNSLFLFTIGPVQSFIAQARKAQDLFMGSFILSYLTFKAIEKLVDRYGPTNVIYPDLYGQPLMDFYLEKIEVKNLSAGYITQPTIPNRFVAIIPETEKEKIKEFAKELESAVRKEWHEMVKKVLDEFQISTNGKVMEVKEKQLKNFPEIYGVAIPLKIDDRDVETNDFSEFFDQGVINKWYERKKFADEKGEFPANIGFFYQLAYSALEKSMGARKNLRGFEQTEEYGKKCHLCGVRDSVIKADDKNLKVGKYISAKEGLCIPCFTKRALDKYLEEIFGDRFKDFSFLSTAEVACSDFKEKMLKEAETKQLFKEYVEEFKKVVRNENFNSVSFLPKLQTDDLENLDGEWFFEENLTERMFEKQFGIKVSESQIKELKDKLNDLTDKDKVGEKPNPYYAILMLDADNMGKWLSGEKLPSIECAYNSETWMKLPQDFKADLKNQFERKLLTPAIHASISHALRNYSIEFVRKIVEEEHYGKLIYAGGDDVLAFVNLKDLFDVMRKLRAAFSGNIKIENNEIKVEWENNSGFVEKDGRLILTMGKKATASCGVVIAHYKTPLKIVMDKVREMERKAKEGEKDAFAIALLKHSGEERIGKSKWRYGELEVLCKLMKLGEYFKKEKDDEPWISKRFIYNLDKEFKRLKDEKGYFTGIEDVFNIELKRLITRASHGKNEKEKKAMVNETFKFLNEIFWKTGGNIDNFVHLLEITAFVAKAKE